MTTEYAPPRRKRAKQKRMADSEGPFVDPPPEIPDIVQAAADKYQEVKKLKGRADAKLKTADEDLQNLMNEHHIASVRVETDDGPKMIDRRELHSLKYRSVMKDDIPDADDDE